jgi:antitoxin CptB
VPINPQATVSPTLDQEARRLLWRCRRGMKELDVLLERFARRELPDATSEQRQTLTRFLELPDPVLIDYLLGQAIPADPELARLVHRIAGQAAADRAKVDRSSADRASADRTRVGCASADRAGSAS